MKNNTIKIDNYVELKGIFFKEMCTTLQIPDTFEQKISRLFDLIEIPIVITNAKATSIIWGEVRKKFNFEKPHFKNFIDKAAAQKVIFNYSEKADIEELFCFGCEGLEHLRQNIVKKIGKDFFNHNFKQLSLDEVRIKLQQELECATSTRKDSIAKDRSEDILLSLFSAFSFHIFGADVIRKSNASSALQDYNSLSKYLHQRYGDLFDRSNALKILHTKLDHNISLLNQINASAKATSHLYGELSNHGFMAMVLSGDAGTTTSQKWLWASKIILFSEKFLNQKIENKFFDHTKIKQETIDYTGGEDANFDVANLGFLYRDCIVLGSGEKQTLVLLFQKHVADERALPCPCCWGDNVQGNSYSSLGIKSWECKEDICKDKSKFNRGKRYSFWQNIMQAAIGCEENEISRDLINAWSRDVQPYRDIHSITEMLIKFYSRSNDGVELINFPTKDIEGWKRALEYSVITPELDAIDYNVFTQSDFFKRILIDKVSQKTATKHTGSMDCVRPVLGEAFSVLKSLPSAVFDGAVTSPPYYNAKEYSQWNNIYTYLYDMYNISKETFRTLKPGSYYLFNIFNYFDNENIIVKSAMGKKRIILAEYIVEIFEKIGFELEGNIVWDKGHIEGNRSFNQGNLSPFYQAPLNCWEHILVFRKPSNKELPSIDFPNMAAIQPVYKMVNGVNKYGHTAPFPVALPNLLCEKLPAKSVVLDPFAGSMTTGVSALRNNCYAYLIEQNEEYYNLGKSILEQEASQPSFIL